MFLGRPEAPDAEEQLEVYRKIAESLDGQRVTVRSSMSAATSRWSSCRRPPKANPFLGVRGIRLSLAHPELLAEQLIAVAQLAHETPVSVIFPMISTLDELFAARRLLDDAISRTGRQRPHDLQVGIMVEVPAAA